MSTILYWYDEDTLQTHEIRFDAVTSATLEDTTTITEHPVETGSNITDHAREEPSRFSIEGVVSAVISIGQAGVVESPSIAQFDEIRRIGVRQEVLSLPNPPIQPDAGGRISAGIGALNAKRHTIEIPIYGKSQTSVPITILERTIPGYRPREIYESLLDAKTKRAMFVISTRFRDYYDMQIERLALLRSPDDGTSGRFQVDFRRVIITETEMVAAPVPAEARGAGPRNRGAQATKPAETPDPSKMKSTLFEGGERLGIW